MVLGQNKSFYLSQRLKCSCKYLTYKEWKHPVMSVGVLSILPKVSTLPIRNGNSTWKEFACPRKIVSTLPIRNGNLIDVSPLLLFLS